MFSKKITSQIEKLIAKIPSVIGENSLHHDIDDLLAGTLPKMRFCVVDDKFTSEAFGDDIFRAVKGKNEHEHITLQGLVEASEEQAKHIRERSKKCDALVAVGSGTIGDLCKYASHLDGKPYIIFPTAASMNGYLSANASISFSGHKTTVPAHLPEAVFCDFSVIAGAPTRLSQAGLGDSLARPTAQADWLLSNLLLGTPYKADVFALLEEVEEEVFDSASGIASGDLASIKKLSELLLLSGLSMTIAGGSYPASQGEHMIAHAHGMLATQHSALHTLKPLHGEEIAITTLHMARLQEKLLHSKAKFASDIFPENEMNNLFGEELAGEFKAEFVKKTARIRHCEEALADVAIQKNERKKDWISSPKLARNDEYLIHDNLAKSWQNIAEKIEKISMPAQKIEAILKKATATTLPKDIGWSDEDFKNTCDYARFTRDRFTFLDLL